MLGRRLVAVLVAVLCIAGWIGVGVSTAGDDEVAAITAPGLVGRDSIDAEGIPEPTLPDGFVGGAGPGVPWVRTVALGPWHVARGAAPALGRKGEPGAPRGPPLLVVS